MALEIRIDERKLASQATALERMLEGRLADATAKLRADVVETAVEAAYALADRTFPKGPGFVEARNELTFELSQLYATGGKVYDDLAKRGGRGVAAAFYAAFKSGNFSQAEEIVRKAGGRFSGVPIGRLDPSLHDRFRNSSTGRIAVDFYKQIVPGSELKAYTEKAIQRLGKTASGWLACAEQLGGDGNRPPWKGTARHGSAGGSATIHETPFGLTVQMANHSKLALGKHLSPGQVKAIKGRAHWNLKQRLVTGDVMRALRKRKSA